MQNTKLSFLIGCLLLIWAINANGQAFEHPKLNRALKDSLKTEIEAIVVLDQKYRWMIQLGEMDETKLDALKQLPAQGKYKRMQYVMADKIGISHAQRDSLGYLQSLIDTVNFHKISGIIRKFGYPKKYVETYKVSTVLLHNSGLIDKHFLDILLQEVQSGNMSASEYAMVYDDVQVINKLPQLYDVSDLSLITKKLTGGGRQMDLAATNKARKAIGLKKLKE